MKKRLISFLLVIGMIVSLVPFAALADEDAAPEEVVETIAPEKVEEAIDQAQKSEIAAGAGAVLVGDTQIATDESAAASKQGDAEQKLDQAQEVVDNANAETAKQEGIAEEALDTAEKAAEESEKQEAIAEEAADKAEDALKDAQEAESKDQAEAAADKAEEQYQVAADAAADAVIKANEAQTAANEAKAAYDAAQAEYDAAKAEADQLLAEGLISMEEAQKLTQAAADRANEKYNVMVIAQAEAEEATAAAKQEADAAKATLAAEAAKLEEVSEGYGQALKTEAVTGPALETAKTAVEEAQAVVDKLDGEIEPLEAQVEELTNAITAADEAIAQANADLAALDEEDAAYPQAVAQLKAAEEAKAAAEQALKNAQTVLDGKKQAASEESMKQLQEAVRSEDGATDEQKLELTKIVLNNTDGVGSNLPSAAGKEIDWVEGEDGFFYIKDADGTISYYQMVEAEGKLNYYKAEFVPETKVDNMESAQDAFNNASAGDEDWSGETRETVYKAYDKKGNPYSVTVKHTTDFFGRDVYTYYVNRGDTSRELKNDGNGFYFGIGYKTYLTINTISHYEPLGTVMGDSNAVTDYWATEEEKIAGLQGNVNDKQAELDEAQEAYDEQKVIYDGAKDRLNKVIKDAEEGMASDEQTVKELQVPLAELNKELNGGVGDELLRAMIESEAEIVRQHEARIKELEDKGFSKTRDEWAELNELKNYQRKGEWYETVMALDDDGNVSALDAASILSLLSDKDVAPSTRLLIATAVKKVFEDHYNAAVAKVQAVEAQTRVVATATQNVADKTEALVKAQAAEAAAKTATAKAASLKTLADDAAEDAKAAYEAYKKLAETYGPSDLAVLTAESAYKQAQLYADSAKAAADEAVEEARLAGEAAAAARKIADEFPVPEDEEEPVVKQPAVEPTLAQFAYRLRGALTADFIEDPANLTNPAFVEAVFAKYGMTIKFESNKVEDVEKVGTRIENEKVKSGDIICILAEDGTVMCFGIYYGDGIYVFFNETTKQVETAKCADAANGWFAIRVEK